MNHQTVAAALEAEHQEIDRGLAAFDLHLANGSWKAERLHGAADALRRHIYLEEAFLFPPLRDGGLIAPVAVMLREHGEIWLALDAVERAADAADTECAQRRSAQLSGLLAAHNEKEEVILYPAAEKVLDTAELVRLKEQISSGTLPPAWVCASARGDSARAPFTLGAAEGSVPLGSSKPRGEDGCGA